ncbi:YbhB/YbcL family Raf kinase inhibitor-like protein [uncultured Clostridium sp.]|uniref:YbhB/YbcL family Raf kinase inhibitor-like protein n=1 Tax=uncultured Clostridium sp. TaxID=59620 RepID=UPI00262064B5|nr:YbhB/YbcL family Raf kinase inhibitor-like protein [uncultured Clostridium sp.]
MKKWISGIVLIVGIILIIVAGVMYNESTKNIPIRQLTVTSTGVHNGVWDAQYGAASKDKIGAMPTVSVPLKWTKGPADTKSYAITLVDNDTTSIVGFPWIHWVTANIPANVTSLAANASRDDSSIMVQGVNSYAAGDPLPLPSIKGFRVPRQDAEFYGGMVPVNFAHTYTLTVYALNTKLDLKPGYTYGQLMGAMQGHIVGQGQLLAKYNAAITKA